MRQNHVFLLPLGMHAHRPLHYDLYQISPSAFKKNPVQIGVHHIYRTFYLTVFYKFGIIAFSFKEEWLYDVQAKKKTRMSLLTLIIRI
jgi:hypothetical protein